MLSREQEKKKKLSVQNFLTYFSGTILDAEAFSITEFIKFSSGEIKSSERILDAGAGSCPYRSYFDHAEYESTDFEDIFDKSSKQKHNFICSLENIPKPNNHYDAIINTQVLEHVEKPQEVINALVFLLLPFYIISFPICKYLIPLAFFYLDRLDKKQDYTLGYACYCTK